MMLGVTTLAAIVLGFVLPLGWRVWGFAGAAALLFVAQATVRTANGYEGLSFEETMLLFNDSWVSYIGYNLQVTSRAFAVPLFGLAAVLVWRLGR